MPPANRPASQPASTPSQASRPRLTLERLVPGHGVAVQQERALADLAQHAAGAAEGCRKIRSRCEQRVRSAQLTWQRISWHAGWRAPAAEVCATAPRPPTHLMRLDPEKAVAPAPPQNSCSILPARCSRFCCCVRPSVAPARLRCSSCASSCGARGRVEGRTACRPPATAAGRPTMPKGAGTHPHSPRLPSSPALTRTVRSTRSPLGSPRTSSRRRCSASPSPSQKAASCLGSAGCGAGAQARVG